MPEWYVLMTAAKWMGVPPWDLLEQPAIWTDWALAAIHAENEAQRKDDPPHG
jgi:hypothetical protein